MSREVYKNITLPPNNWCGKIRNKRRVVRKLPKGLSIVHIGGNIWSIGKLNTKTNHRVIYSPDGKEYHLYGNDAIKLSIINFDWYDENIISKLRVNHSQVKIYILTNILDSVDNWCFDLSNKPKTGDTVKVIYDNGTIKNIVFSGEFEKIKKQKYSDYGYDCDYQYMIPVGYRIK
jgi:hypothetical protein